MIKDYMFTPPPTEIERRKTQGLYSVHWFELALTLIVLGGGVYLGHTTQNLVRCARVHKIMT